jgi:hypothetical protein
MTDLLMFVITLVFFIATLGYLALCERVGDK